MLLEELAHVSRAVASTPSRSEKVELIAGVLERLDPDEMAAGVSFLSGRPTQSPLGVGFATVHSIEERPADSASLVIADVDETLAAIAGASGPGSKSRKEQLLRSLMRASTGVEQEFLRGLILRNVRQGALEGLMVDAVARALAVEPDRVRRAAMLEGDLVGVASRSLAEGKHVLATSTLELFTPIQPMLAKTSQTAGSVIEEIGPCLVESKLDGARIQVHRSGARVAVFTRNLRDVTDGLGEVVELALGLPADEFIVDGESLLMAPGGAPQPFQESMSRFGSGGDRASSALSAFFFDCLRLEGMDLVDRPLRDRRAALEGFVPRGALVDSILVSDPGEADRLFESAVEAGFEGVVVKDPDTAYQAGRRGSAWRKVKPTHTLDLVILAAEWGSGRRRGWLSNLHLGARDPEGGYVMLGKTFKGLTDEMLEWQTGRFLELESGRDGHVVYLEPEVVYEIAFDGIQRSTRYPGGVALRFARVRGYRPDKTPDEADTIDTVRSYAR